MKGVSQALNITRNEVHSSMSPARLDQTEAAVLFQVLDETIGVFRFPDMEERDWKYWAITRERFLSTFTTNVPSTFWFQGKLDSCMLGVHEGVFRVKAYPENPEEEAVLEECNRLLSSLAIETDLTLVL